MSAATGTTAIYTRISSDKAGAGLGVARQEKEIRAHLKVQGQDLGGIKVYTDNDLSAFSGKTRPGYQQLLADIEQGRVTQLAAWHPDRLHRNLAELEDFINLVEATGVSITTAKSGDLDLSTASGRAMARMVGVMARMESEHKVERITSKHAELAASGAWSGGSRPFGYDLAGKSLVARDDEAPVAREIASRLLAGEALHSVAADLNARGITTAAGGAWRGPNIRSMMLSHTITGLRSHKSLQRPVEAQWDGIVDRDTWHALGGLLRDPSRRITKTTARRHALTGLAVCGECGLPMRGRNVGGRSPKAYTAYICQSTKHVQLPTARVHATVAAGVALRLSEAGDVGTLLGAGDDGTAARLDAEESTLQHRLEGLADDYADGVLDRDQMKRSSARIKARLGEIATERSGLDLDGARPAAAFAGLMGHDYATTLAKWEALDMGRQRTVIAALGTIRMLPAEHRGQGYTDQRVVIDWHRTDAAMAVAA